ncbi:MAG: hypothetical protein ACNA8W_15070, partial [Bradymonadaceae bacterium]
MPARHWTHPLTLFWCLSITLALMTAACGPGPMDPEPFDPVLTGDVGGTDTDAGVDPDANADVDVDADVNVPIELCDDEPEDWDPRPRWGEVTSGYPNYQELSSNFNFLNSIKLLTSMFTKLTSTLENIQKAGDDQVEGYCLCNCDFGPTQLPSSINLSEMQDWLSTNANNYSACFDEDQTREGCTTYCTGLPAAHGVNAADPVVVWGSNDLFTAITSLDGTAETGKRFALEFIATLDGVSDFLQSNDFNAVLSALSSVGAALKDFQQLIQSLLEYVDRFTSGYHLGGYSEQRPDLHMCVGYAGHGVYAQMGNLGGDKASIGARYTSHNLSKSHRAQFRSGGFGVSAFGKSLSILPSVEANIQVDGFSFWNAQEPFGIPAHVTTITSQDVEDYDVFQLVDTTELGHIADSNGEIHIPGSLFIANHYPVEYTSAVDNQSYVWPRPGVLEPWEEPSMAVMSAGLNLDLEIEPIVKELPAIPIFPGAQLSPYFKLGAGVGWMHDAFYLLERIRDEVNAGLPASHHLTNADFAREMHDLQAPDVSEDNGTVAYVRPELGANLLVGFALAKWLEVGIFANVGIGAQVQPGGYGGVVDMNYALVEAMVNSNPPADAPCTAVFEIVEGMHCSNTAVIASTTTYACGEGEGPACEEHGYCVDVDGEISAYDVTEAECTGDDGGGHNGGGEDRGRCCIRHDATAFQNITCEISEQECDAADGHWVAAGVCTDNTNPSDCSNRDDPAGDDDGPSFVKYSCARQSQPELTGWEGPGCHPLGQGFMSACGCSSDDDCATGESCGADNVCLGAQGYSCVCDPGDPNSCDAGRTCHNGACVKDCTADTDCASGRVCDAGMCKPPHGIPSAEEIVWGMQNVDAPMHAVSTYALSDLELWAFLTAGINIKLKIKIFGKTKELKLFDWSDVWELASLYKIWYQPGLEARYHSQCTAELGEVTNRQPQPVTSSATNLPAGFLSGHVERYPQTPLTQVYDGNAGSTEDFIAWCKPDMQENVEDPDAPQLTDIANSLTDTVDWGEEIGLELWQNNQLCIDGQPWHQWAQNVGGSIEDLYCLYDDPVTNQQHSWKCSDALFEVMAHWGCLDTNLSIHAGQLADAFAGIHSGGVFDLSQMLSDPAGELEVGNLL